MNAKSPILGGIASLGLDVCHGASPAEISPENRDTARTALSVTQTAEKPLKPQLPRGYALSIATVTEVVELNCGKFAYEVKYDIPETEAKGIPSAGGKPVKGPIVQAAISDKRPVKKQRIRVMYDIKEPIRFRKLEPLAFEMS